MVEAISLAYELAGQPSPMAVRSHSTRSMAASKALISEVALQEVCDAAGTCRYGGVILTFPKASNRRNGVPSKGNVRLRL